MAQAKWIESPERVLQVLSSCLLLSCASCRVLVLSWGLLVFCVLFSFVFASGLVRPRIEYISLLVCM